MEKEEHQRSNESFSPIMKEGFVKDSLVDMGMDIGDNDIDLKKVKHVSSEVL